MRKSVQIVTDGYEEETTVALKQLLLHKRDINIFAKGGCFAI